MIVLNKTHHEFGGIRKHVWAGLGMLWDVMVRAGLLVVWSGVAYPCSIKYVGEVPYLRVRVLTDVLRHGRISEVLVRNEYAYHYPSVFKRIMCTFVCLMVCLFDGLMV